jgi:hypothetical protein
VLKFHVESYAFSSTGVCKMKKVFIVAIVIILGLITSGCGDNPRTEYNNTSIPRFGNGEIFTQENSSLDVHWGEDRSYIIIKRKDYVYLYDDDLKFSELMAAINKQYDVKFIVPFNVGGNTISYTIILNESKKTDNVSV